MNVCWCLGGLVIVALETWAHGNYLWTAFGGFMMGFYAHRIVVALDARRNDPWL